MKKIVREVDEKLGIVQVTTADERWYIKQVTNPATKLPELLYVPSVTWIANFYPKGEGFMRWYAEHGYDEAQALKQAAGIRGSKVHEAISAILRCEEVRIDSKFINPETEQEEELTLEEVDAIVSYVNWRKEMEADYAIEVVAFDVTVFSEKHGYAGSIDVILRLTPKPEGKNPMKLTGPTPFIIDFKTSQDVYPAYELQLSAYREPLLSGEFFIEGFRDVADIRLAILQIGYRRNKAGYKWNIIEPKFSLFLAARQIWQNECNGAKPKQKDYPIVISPALTAADISFEQPKEAVPEETVAEHADIPDTPRKAGKK